MSQLGYVLIAPRVTALVLISGSPVVVPPVQVGNVYGYALYGVSFYGAGSSSGTITPGPDVYGATYSAVY